MRLIVDAMGTDERPLPDVRGAVLAARETSDTIVLVGNQPQIEQILSGEHNLPDNIEILQADEEITMSDKPSVVMKRKPGSSMHVGMRQVKDGQADAFITMGNTGAAHAIATLSTLRRIPGVRRPALTAIYPVRGKNTIFLDIGANADSRVEWLEQFAVMGNIYAQKVLGRTNPRIATLSNGEEEGKGNNLVREAQEGIRNLPLNYIGHVEPKEIMSGTADVIVVDGFVGNIFIKTFEASVKYFADITREEIMSDLPSQIGGLLTRGAFRRVKKRLDTGEVGGAPLLGVNGIVIIGHGGSDAAAVKNAIHQARMAVKGNVVEEIRLGLQQIQEPENA
jgi:glycerol-3-phosphate acyltransferase PlsX